MKQSIWVELLILSTIAILMLISLSAWAVTATIKWEPVTSDARVGGYELHWGAGSGSYQKSKVIPGQTTDTVTTPDLGPGTWFFAVRSRTADGSMVSVFSNEVSMAVAGLTTPLKPAKVRLEITRL